MKILNTKGILFFICAILFVACNKKYGYEFEDGVSPGGEKEDITVDTSMSTIDRSLYHRARIFPGLVDAAEPRLKDFEVELNLNYVPTNRLRVSVTPSGIHSVGLYAPPGELIKVIVPEGVEGLTLQIGVHTDDLTGKYPLDRDPVIYNVKALYPGVNYLRNLYGGLIWIRTRQPVVGPPVKLTFTGAVKTLDFILGETNEAEWKEKLKTSFVPWLELRSRFTIYTLPRNTVLELMSRGQLNDLNGIMTEWNNVYEKDFYEWMGLKVDNTDLKHRAPDLPERGVVDIQISAGSGHSGYPWMGMLDWATSFLDLDDLRSGGAWGIYHEVGHNYQQGNWSWPGLGETTNNLFIFKGAQRRGTGFNYRDNLREQFPLGLAFTSASGTKNFDTFSKDPFFKILPFLQLFHQAKNKNGDEDSGWGIMTALYTNTRNLEQYQLSNNIVDQKDFVYETVCDYTGKDYYRFFFAWGIKISRQSRAKIAAKNYPKITTELWKYDPITKTGGDTPIPPIEYHDASSWTATVSSFSKDGPNGANGVQGGTIQAALDGDPTTFWHSQYGPTIKGPHWFIVNMQELYEVNGFYFQQRNNQRNFENAEIWVSYAQNTPAENSSSWEKIMDVKLIKSNYTQQKFRIPLGETKTFKFIKVVVPSINPLGEGDGDHLVSLAEFGTYNEE